MGLCFGFSAAEEGSHRVKASSAFLGMAEHLPVKVMNYLFPWFALLACAAFVSPKVSLPQPLSFITFTLLILAPTPHGRGVSISAACWG